MSLPIFHNNLYELMIDDRSYTHNISSCEIKAWKKKKKESGLNGISTHDLCDTGGAVFHPPIELSSNLEAGHFVSS